MSWKSSAEPWAHWKEIRCKGMKIIRKEETSSEVFFDD